MKIKNPIVFILCTVFAVVNLVDIITARNILQAEANPLYLLTKSLWPIFLLKIFFIVVIFFIYKHNKYPNNFTYYMFLLIVVMGSLIMAFGAYGNIIAMNNPEILAASASIPVKEKVRGYAIFSTLVYIIPMALSLFTFKLYEWSLKHTVIEKPDKWYKT